MSETTNYRVLARKYRPVTLPQLVGQDTLVKTLTQGIENNRLPHAFILHGIRGVGKTTTARILALALNCIGPDGAGGPTAEPCGTCKSCVAITQDRHLDVVEMDAASRTGVDDIREVIEAARYRAVEGRYKIYIIDEVHMLSKNAFNALLKTLEEPPPHVKFIFATTELRKIPDTILSRCMRFDLNRITPQILLTHFSSIAEQEHITLEGEALSLIVRAADGSVRDGLSLLDQAIALCGKAIDAKSVRDMLGLVDRGQIFALFESLMEGNVAESLAKVRDFYHQGGDPVVILKDLLDLTYWLTCLKTVPHLAYDTTWPESERQQGDALAKRLAMPVLMRAWQVLMKGYEETLRSPVPLQAVEMIVVRLAYVSDLPWPSELVRSVQEGPKTTTIKTMVAAASPVPSPQPTFEPEGAVLPASFAEMVELVSKAREPMMYSHLLQDVHLISYEPGKIALRLGEKAPASLPVTLKAILEKVTQSSWTIDVSDQGGQPTVAVQKRQESEQLLEEKRQHPVVQSILETFPGSQFSITND